MAVSGLHVLGGREWNCPVLWRAPDCTCCATRLRLGTADAERFGNSRKKVTLARRSVAFYVARHRPSFVQRRRPVSYPPPTVHISRPNKLQRAPLSCIWQAQKWLMSFNFADARKNCNFLQVCFLLRTIHTFL